MNSTFYGGGFSNPPVQAASWFRGLMKAMARPGRIEMLVGAQPPAPMSPAAGAALLTLADGDTPVHLAPSHDVQVLREWLSFHTAAVFVEAQDAEFALGTWDTLKPLDRFSLGSPSYPDRSATLIVEMATLEAQGATLRGPGIKNTAQLSLPEIDAFRANRALFPLGLDFCFTAGSNLAALPRSSEVAPCMSL